MIKSNYNLLLMTWTIRPNVWILKQWYSKSTDPKERLKQYLSTILYYLSIENIDWIVFIDNSNYIIDENIILHLREISDFLWKDIEFLKFQWDVSSQLEYTYWYWEFETLEHMYNNSTLLKKTSSIYKVTWRYKIYNIYELIRESFSMDNVLYKYNIFSFRAINTVFFKLSIDNIRSVIEDYNKHFRENKDSLIRYWWEEIFYLCLKNKPKKNSSIRVYPYFYYMSHRKYNFYQFLTIIGFFNLNGLLYSVLYKLTLIIPVMIKLYFNKILRFILKFN